MFKKVKELKCFISVCFSKTNRPHDTPFEDGTFKLTIEFTEEYPNKPPTVRFVSKMFHPNVYADGGICLDILQNRWSPTYDVSAILTSIQVLVLQIFLNNGNYSNYYISTHTCAFMFFCNAIHIYLHTTLWSYFVLLF